MINFSAGNTRTLPLISGFLGGTIGKEPFCQDVKGCGFDSWVRKVPWRKAWQSTPVFLSGESHGQRSLMATYNPSGYKELDTTEAT